VNETRATLRKPLLLEEFGKRILPAELSAASIVALRDRVYRLTYALVEAHVARGSPLVGSLFWRWDLRMFRDEKTGAPLRRACSVLCVRGTRVAIKAPRTR